MCRRASNINRCWDSRAVWKEIKLKIKAVPSSVAADFSADDTNRAKRDRMAWVPRVQYRFGHTSTAGETYRDISRTIEPEPDPAPRAPSRGLAARNTHTEHTPTRLYSTLLSECRR